jgi:hypothetical protein
MTPTPRLWPVLLSLALAACDPPPVANPGGQAPAKAPPAPKAEAGGDVKTVEVGKNVTLEVRGDTRRVLVPAAVCFREGLLEVFLCRKNTKEHEAILHADVDARVLHAALLAAGAKAGSTVKYEPKYQPATGSVVKVTVRYAQDGKEITRPAQEWVREVKSKKAMTHDWVFAGSFFVDDPDDPNKKQYAANGGDVICLSNFETAMLDLPINSSKDNDDLQFEAFTDRIPPLGTPVTVILEPVPEKK